MSSTTYCYNLAGAMSSWPGVAFARVWRQGDTYYGIASDGIYELGGTTDSTVAFTARVTTAETNFGKSNLKRLPYLRIDATGVGTVAGVYDGVQSTGQRTEFTNARRVKLGRGDKGRLIAIDIQSASPDFDLRVIETAEEHLQRGVR